MSRRRGAESARTRTRDFVPSWVIWKRAAGTNGLRLLAREGSFHRLLIFRSRTRVDDEHDGCQGVPERSLDRPAGPTASSAAMDTLHAAELAGDADVETVTDIITRSFAKDPVWGAAYPPELGDGRSAIWRLEIAAAIPFGWTWLSVGHEAAAVWIPPGSATFDVTQMQTYRVQPLVRRILCGDRPMGPRRPAGRAPSGGFDRVAALHATSSARDAASCSSPACWARPRAACARLLPEPARHASRPSRSWSRHAPVRRDPRARRCGGDAGISRVDESGQRRPLRGRRLRGDQKVRGLFARFGRHDDVAARPR